MAQRALYTFGFPSLTPNHGNAHQHHHHPIIRRHLLWRHPKCDGPQINLLIRLDAGQNKKYTCNQTYTLALQNEMRNFQNKTKILSIILSRCNFFYLERSWQIVYLHFDLPLLNIKTGCHKLNTGNDDLDVDHCKSGEKVKSVPYLCAVAVIGIPLT